MLTDKFNYGLIDLYNKSISELHRYESIQDLRTLKDSGSEVAKGDSLGTRMAESMATMNIINILGVIAIFIITVASALVFVQDSRTSRSDAILLQSIVQRPGTDQVVPNPLKYASIAEFTTAGPIVALGTELVHYYYFPTKYTDLRELSAVSELDLAEPIAVPVYNAPVLNDIDLSLYRDRSGWVPDLVLGTPDAKLPPPIIYPPMPIFSINFLGLGDIQVDYILEKAQLMSYNYNITRNEFDNYELFRVYRQDDLGNLSVNGIQSTLVGEFNTVEDAIIYANSIGGNSLINRERFTPGFTDITICCLSLDNAELFAKSIDEILLNRPIHINPAGYR